MPVSNCTIQSLLINIIQLFESYYTRKHTGRKISLNTLLGTADVKAIFYGSAAMIQDESSQQVGRIDRKKNQIKLN